MKAALQVRAATPADLRAVVALAAALWPDEPVRQVRPHLRDVLAGRPRSTLPLVIFLAERQGTAVGFIEVGLRSHADGCDGRHPVGFIEGWFVLPSERRRGAGRALVAAAERWARGQGCREMASDTWTWNRASVRAHQALGYEVVGRNVNLRRPLR